MTIKINKLLIEKNSVILERLKVGTGTTIRSFKKLEGDINVEISEGNIKGHAKVSIDTVSEVLQDELYNVLSKIENEFNGIENKPSGINVKVGLDLTTKQAASELIESYKVYITDKYAEALKSINEEIEKQIELRSRFSMESKEYRGSLEEEIKLQKNKSDLLEMSAGLIELEIKSEF